MEQKNTLLYPTEASKLTEQQKLAGNIGDMGLRDLIDEMKETFQLFLSTRPVFQTDVGNLDEVYLNAFTDPEERQKANCMCCRRFFRNYGGLVIIDPVTGAKRSAFIDSDLAQHVERPALRAIVDHVMAAKVVAPFRPTWSRLGYSTPKAQWQHYGLDVPSDQMVTEKEAGEFGAVYRANRDVLRDSLREFTLKELKDVLILMEGDAVYRAGNFIEPLRWVIGMKEKMEEFAGRGKRDQWDNLLWLAAATKPIGFCRVINNVVGTLLQDLRDDTQEMALMKFMQKMDPTRYQRAQAEATAGNIRAAEKKIVEMGLASAFKRRYLRRDEAVTFWNPTFDVTAPSVAEASVFGHLTPKGETKSTKGELIKVPSVKLSLEKFIEKHLPDALSMEINIFTLTGIITLMTQEDENAKPILKWDHPEHRNPVSWFFRQGSTRAIEFGLTSAPGWMKVSGLSKMPSQWGINQGMEHQGVIFLLEEFAPDKKGATCLFPEILISELHPFRSTIEAFNEAADKNQVPNSERSAGGLCINESFKGYNIGTGRSCGVEVRITTKDSIKQFEIDRFE